MTGGSPTEATELRGQVRYQTAAYAQAVFAELRRAKGFGGPRSLGTRIDQFNLEPVSGFMVNEFERIMRIWAGHPSS
jgi:hypothetical protein